MNPVIGGLLLRQGLNILSGVLAAHTGYQVTQDEVSVLATAVEGAAAAGSAILSTVLSVKSKKKGAKLK